MIWPETQSQLLHALLVRPGSLFKSRVHLGANLPGDFIGQAHGEVELVDKDWHSAYSSCDNRRNRYNPPLEKRACGQTEHD